MIFIKKNDIIKKILNVKRVKKLTKIKASNLFVLLLCIVLLTLCLCSCGNNSKDDSIIGKWSVTAYELNGETFSKEKAGEYMGEVFASTERPILLFQKSGLVRMYTESGSMDETANYTVTDNIIELYKEDEHGLYLEIDDDKIRLKTDTDNIVMIYTKE